MTRIELENNHLLRRIAVALERIAEGIVINNAICIREISPGYFETEELVAIRQAVQKEVDSLVENASNAKGEQDKKA